MSKLFKLPIKNNSIEKLLEIEGLIFSIAFCKDLNGIFYSDYFLNNISLFDLKNNNVVVYKNENVVGPKSVCLDASNKLVFFEGETQSLSGFSTNGFILSCIGKSTNNTLSSSLSFRKTTREYKPEEFVYKTNCISYIDGLGFIGIAMPNKNIINCVDSNGKMSKLIGSGKNDFSMSTDPFNVCFYTPSGICFIDSIGELFVSDSGNHIIIRHFDKKKWVEKDIIGIPLTSGHEDGNFRKSKFEFPTELCYFDKTLYAVDNKGTRIRQLNLESKMTSTIYKTKNFIKAITCDADNIYFVEI